MVTTYPRERSTQPIAAKGAISEEQGLLARTLGRLQHTWCGLHGHEALLHFEQDRMSLRCSSCGYETPGWEIGDQRPRVRFGGVIRHERVNKRPQIVEIRKIA